MLHLHGHLILWCVPLAQVISLGTHLIEPTSAEPMLLMEVMPSILAKRSFPAPATFEQIEPGYRDAPDPGQNCVIVFSRASVLLWSVTLAPHPSA